MGLCPSTMLAPLFRGERRGFRYGLTSTRWESNVVARATRQPSWAPDRIREVRHCLAVWLAAVLVAGCSTGAQPESPPQPVAFSHKAHSENEITCTSCHLGAETQAQAGLAPLASCATCHRRAILPDHPEIVKVIEYFENREPLVWRKVNVIPDGAMVHFKHKPHARAGVECSSCHGDVGQMTLARPEFNVADMGFCIDCHLQTGASVDCLTCHH